MILDGVSPTRWNPYESRLTFVYKEREEIFRIEIEDMGLERLKFDELGKNGNRNRVSVSRCYRDIK